MSKLLCFLILIIVAFAGLAQSADGEFIHTPRTTAGCNGIVTSSAKMSNGDVIFGGTFTRCGNVRANRVVRFDGTNFFSLGVGPDNGVSGEVRAVFADGSKVYVGGHFKLAGQVDANNVAVFDAGTWRSIGRGSSNGVSGYVRSLQTFQGKLYVGGYDIVSTYNYRARLREWNGAGWRDLANFVDQDAQSSINALTTVNSVLYFGGTFQLSAVTGNYNIGYFDGAGLGVENFPGAGPSFSNIRDLHFFQGRLCVAGNFSFPAQIGGGRGVACRGTQTPGSQWQAYSMPYARALEDNGTALFAAGNPLSSGSILTEIGAGEVPTPGIGGSDYALTLASQNGNLLMGGQLAQRVVPAQGLLRIRAGSIEPVSQGDIPQLIAPLNQLAAHSGKIFGYSENGAFLRPNEYVSFAVREGAIWRFLEPPAVDEGYALSLLTVSDKLYASFADNVAGSRLFERTKLNWTQTASNVWVNAVYADSLVALPRYPQSPGGSRFIQRFNGTTLEPWLEIPNLRRNGVDVDIDNTYGLPLSLIEFQGRPVIAGQFDEIVGVGPVGGVATYYDGAWHALGGGTGLRDPKWLGPDYRLQIRLQVWNGDLYASNGFTEADGQPVDGIARFDGSSWRTVGGGVVQSDNIAARADVQMIVYQDKLYAYGTFDQAGGRAAHGVAQWDGVTWRALRGANGEGLGENSSQIKAVVANGDLVFSGELHEAGGEPEDYFAVWRGSDMIFRSGFE